MSLKTIGEDIVYGAAGLVDEVDEEFGGDSTLAADSYGYFNPGTGAAAVAVEQAGGVDAAFDQTFGGAGKKIAFVGLAIVGLGAFVAGSYLRGR